jgi:DNA-binding YbaB/EbfC family protein
MDLNKLMQQAQQMQNQLSKVEKDLENTEYTGESQGVSVKINGKYEAQSVVISKDLIADDDDREMLQDLLLIAVNEAVKKASDDKENKLGGVTSGMNIPGLK